RYEPEPGRTGSETHSRLKIIEIGDKPFVKQGFPDEVAYFSTAGASPDPVAARTRSDVRTSSIGRLWRALRDPETSLVVCHPTYFAPLHWQSISRAIFSRKAAEKLSSFQRQVGPQLLRWPIPAPIAIFDHEDIPVINSNNFFLLDRCCVYFKRELP